MSSVTSGEQAALFELGSCPGNDGARAARPARSSLEPRALPVLVRPADDDWPLPPGPQVFVGLIGEIVSVLARASEADEVAILVQLLVGFGTAAGRGPHYRVGATHHHANEFVVLVGPSGSGRKGSSWDLVSSVLSRLEEDFVSRRVVCGLSSGEGLIWHVRDDQRGEGADQRLFVLEPELASVLKAASRDGCTLSPVLRNAWDGRVLQVITKHEPARSSAAHISVVGHITAEELVHHVSAVSMANGFLNRFLVLAVRRSKLLPEGGELDALALVTLLARLRDAFSRAGAAGQLAFDDEARAMWWEIYPSLSAGQPGLIGAVLGRAEAHVVRLSLLYALADGASKIALVHLLAALGLWDYAARSAAFVFGDSLGDRLADDIWQAVTSRSSGVTRSQIRDLFDRNRSKVEIDAALRLLVSSGRVDRRLVAGRGRPAETFAARPDPPEHC